MFCFSAIEALNREGLCMYIGMHVQAWMKSSLSLHAHTRIRTHTKVQACVAPSPFLLWREEDSLPSFELVAKPCWLRRHSTFCTIAVVFSSFRRCFFFLLLFLLLLLMCLCVCNLAKSKPTQVVKEAKEQAGVAFDHTNWRSPFFFFSLSSFLTVLVTQAAALLMTSSLMFKSRTSSKREFGRTQLTFSLSLCCRCLFFQKRY